MIRQDIIPGANASGAGLGRLLVPPSFGKLYAAYAFGSDYDPDPTYDHSGNERHLRLFGIGADAASMQFSPLNRMVAPFSGVDLMVGGSFTVAMVSLVPPANRHHAFGNFAGAGVESVSMINNQAEDASCYALTPGDHVAPGTYDATRGDKWHIYIGKFTKTTEGVSSTSAGQPITVGPDYPTPAQIKGGTNPIGFGLSPAAPNSNTDPGRHAMALLYSPFLTGPELGTLHDWVSRELSKSGISV